MNIIKTAAAIAKLLQGHPEIARELKHHYMSEDELAKSLELPKPHWREALTKAMEAGIVEIHEVLETMEAKQ